MSEYEIDKGVTVEQPSVPDLANRRRAGQALVVIAAAVALFVSGWGMFHFFDDLPGLHGQYVLIVPMFLLFDIAGVACAVNARVNRLAYGQMGIEGWLVWVFAGLSGAMSASDADGRGAAVRFAAPLVAAVLFELLIRGERKDAEGSTNGPLDRIKRRVLARVGLLDSIGQSDEDAAKRAAAGRLATRAYRMHQLKEGTGARRRAEAKFHRKLRAATERLQFSNDTEMIDTVRLHLAALYQSVSGTSKDAVADLNLWKAADRVPGEQSGQAASGQVGSVPTAEQADRRADVPTGHSGMAPVEVPAEPARVPVQPVPVEAVAVSGHSPERAEERADAVPVSGAPGGVKRTREEALELFGEQLVEEWLAAGENGITEYRVRTVCGLTARPAAAVHREIRARAEAARRADDEDQGAAVNGHALRGELAELVDQR